MYGTYILYKQDLIKENIKLHKYIKIINFITNSIRKNEIKYWYIFILEKVYKRIDLDKCSLNMPCKQIKII